MLKIYAIQYKDGDNNYYNIELLGTDVIDVKTTFNLSINYKEDYTIIDIKFVSNFIK